MQKLRTPICAVVLIAGLVGACVPPPRQSTSTRELNELVQARVQQRRSVGLAVGVMRADGTTAVAFAGDAGPGALPLSARSGFEIGSITKVFTAILLAEMVRTGEVRYEDPVSRYLPDSVHVPTRNGRQITLLDLATHRSGLPPMPDNIHPADRANYLADYSVAQMYEFLSRTQLKSDPGSDYRYSNYGFGLLGHALARAANKPYAQLLRERVLAPLGLRDTDIQLPGDRDHLMTRGHNRGGAVVPYWDLPTLSGAGELETDLLDMMHFLAANLRSPRSGVEHSVHQAQRSRGPVADSADVRQIDATGMTWQIRTVGGSPILWKDGGTAGFQTFVGFDPVKRVGAVVLSNTNIEVDDLGFHLIDPSLPLGAPRPIPVRIQLPGSALGAFVGEYSLSADESLFVTRQGGELLIHWTGYPEKTRIVPEAENRFFMEGTDADFTFTRDAAGAVTGVVARFGDSESRGRRVR
jgi:D-alanyl-D-alanine-carboxypeptidase/D-alanyl-D-alanine-endopeptidase